MANPIKRGESGSQVSSWNPTSSSTSTSGLISTIVPYGLTLQRTITQTYRTEMISNMSATATVLTVTCQHSFFVGQRVTISGATPSVYNITGTIATVVQIGIGYNNSFTINTTATNGAGTYTGGGTVSSGSLDIPVPWVYAIIAGAGGSSGGGGSPSYLAGGGAGGIAWGWTVASPSCIVGLGAGGGSGNNSNYTRYGNIIAGGGTGYAGAGFLGSAGGGSSTGGGTNYWGMPGGTTLQPGAGAGGGFNTNIAGVAPSGANGISGGGGGTNYTTTGNSIGGNGGSGLAGGAGGASLSATTGTRSGGSGGNGYNIATGQVTLGGGPQGNNGGGGGGIGGNAVGSTGGLGGGGGGSGGFGGNGIIYLYW